MVPVTHLVRAVVPRWHSAECLALPVVAGHVGRPAYPVAGREVPAPKLATTETPKVFVGLSPAK